MKTNVSECFPNEGINPTITFEDIHIAIQNGTVYETLGVAESVVREMVFEKLSEIMECPYDLVYKAWLNEEPIDLFECPPKVLEPALNEFEASDHNYSDCKKLKKNLETLGYTCDYYLSAEPFNLRKL